MTAITAIKPQPVWLRNRSVSFHCSECGGRIGKGEEFYSVEGVGRIHLDCLADAEAKPASCTSCFMVCCEC